jgi:proline racemase
VVKALLETGMIEKEERASRVVLDTAGGVVKAEAKLGDGGLEEISFEGIASFYQESTSVKVQNVGKINIDIAFGGLYYVFVDPKEAKIAVKPENSETLIRTGMKILAATNKQVKVKHPENPALSRIELVTFSAKPVESIHSFRHANVYANTICVSPAGTSVSAKLATLWARKEIKKTGSLTVESLIHPRLTMTGQVAKEVRVGSYPAIIPRLSARAYVIGLEHIVIEKDDPIKHGFLLG